MNARIFSSGDRSGKNPGWYWTKGLHDAEITHVDALEHPIDYRQTNPIRNSLILHLDTSNALFDRTITSIELRNYKILLDESPIGVYPGDSIGGCYWMQDVLTWEKGKYILEITLLGEDDFHFTVQFENVAVNRK